MDKYYTPEIEEFHIGFEVECYDDNDKTWDIVYIDSQPALCNITGLNLNIRVKYLDREDIESLGWIYKGGKTIKKGKAYFSDEKEVIGITLRPNFFEDNHASIHIYALKPSGGIQNTIFAGKIKNRTELKKLLKQLNLK